MPTAPPLTPNHNDYHCYLGIVYFLEVPNSSYGVTGGPEAFNGIFDSETEKSVKELQKNAGLAVDGIVGDRTWFELSKM